MTDAAGEDREVALAAVVLAAGQGARFGAATKQLAELDGQPLIAHAVATARVAGCRPIVVVTGHDADEVVRAARAADPSGDVEVAHNPSYRDGQASSLRAGLAVLQARVADGGVVLVLLADQPGIAPDAADAVVGAVRRGAEAARVRYLDGVGHPVAFAARVLARLTAVTGDAGARQLMGELDVVEVTRASAMPPDVDTPGALGQVRAARRTAREGA
ncbi:MAG: nucleotidyltransferase family protein [Nitriliruptoraceae bacterium]|nr:nucleotidyltransferase family protein [Nitriliruptoraceae bacterium]